MSSPPTLNLNPVVLEISSDPHHKRNALEWPELAAISAPPDEDTFVLPNKTGDLQRSRRPIRFPDDMAVLGALTDASIESKGKAVSLLRNLGLYYPVDIAQIQEKRQQNHIPNWSAPTTPTPRQLIRQPEDVTRKVEQDRDTIDADEIFDIVRNIQDPEHPLTLEQLGVVSTEQITVNDRPDGPFSTVDVRFTPTIPHCSMATQIGLCLKVKLDRSLPRFKTAVRIEPGTHASEKAINKQLADKERVCAALENKHLLEIVNKCILNGMTGHRT